MTAGAMDVHRRQITSRARAARPGPVLAAVLTGVAMALGWVLAKTLGLVWYALAWLVAAFWEGWVTGWDHRPRVTAPPG
jgi:hypothetical protein